MLSQTCTEPKLFALSDILASMEISHYHCAFKLKQNLKLLPAPLYSVEDTSLRCWSLRVTPPWNHRSTEGSSRSPALEEDFTGLVSQEELSASNTQSSRVHCWRLSEKPQSRKPSLKLLTSFFSAIWPSLLLKFCFNWLVSVIACYQEGQVLREAPDLTVDTFKLLWREGAFEGFFWFI